MRAARRLALRSSRSSMVSLREVSLAKSLVLGSEVGLDLDELFLDFFLRCRDDESEDELLLELELLLEEEEEERDLFFLDLLR